VFVYIADQFFPLQTLTAGPVVPAKNSWLQMVGFRE